MHVGAQMAVGGHFRNLADVYDEASRDGRRIDPAASRQPEPAGRHLLLQEEFDEPQILVDFHT